MIHLDYPQGGRDWIYARLGRPTASQFGRLITKTGKPSAAADGYVDQLLAEYLIGEPLDDELTQYMERGRDMEDSAVRFYEGIRDLDTTVCGFCLTDDRRAGASPDRFVGDDGLLELKVPSASVHVGYIRQLRNPKPNKYYAQIQGQLWVTSRRWIDFMSFHPTIRPVVVRYERDEAFLKTLGEIVTDFCDWLDEERSNLTAQGYEPQREAA